MSDELMSKWVDQGHWSEPIRKLMSFDMLISEGLLCDSLLSLREMLQLHAERQALKLADQTMQLPVLRTELLSFEEDVSLEGTHFRKYKAWAYVWMENIHTIGMDK